MAEIQRVKRIAPRAPGTGEVQSIVDSAAGKVLPDGKLHGLLVFGRAERYQGEICQD